MKKKMFILPLALPNVVHTYLLGDGTKTGAANPARHNAFTK